MLNLSDDDIKFDITKHDIHFENGYYDLKKLQFSSREVGKHYVTQYIQRDYAASTESQKNDMKALISKIYPNKKDLECIISILGSALSGDSMKDQEIVFLLGPGSSGKSTILKTTAMSIECYLKELQSDMFTQGNTKIDKILNSFSKSPQVRISWVNEMNGKKIDDTLFKKYCEGELQTTKLYQENQHVVKHLSKCIITSNEMPNFRVDSGMSRRIRAYTHDVKFVKDSKHVNEDQNIFLGDCNLLDKLNNSIMLNAWFDILAEKCHSYLKGKKIIFTDNFKETKSDIMTGNDYFQDFIDSCLDVTNIDKERISKESMKNAFLKQYPDKHLTVLQVMTSLKDKGLVYNSKYRCENIQGCYVGVKFKTDDFDDGDLDANIIEDDKSIDVVSCLKTLVEKLTKENAELKAQLQKKKSKKNKNVIIIDDTPSEDIEADNADSSGDNIGSQSDMMLEF
jgi:hypothetical protein